MKTLTVVTWFSYLVLILLCGLIAYLLWYPYNPIQIDKVSILNQEVSPGDRQCFQFKGEKFMKVPVDVFIEITNGENIPIINYPSNQPIGTVFKWRCFRIPSQVEPGKYKLKWTGVYHVNPIRDVIKTASSDCFNIVDKIGDAKKAAIEKQNRTILHQQAEIMENSKNIDILKNRMGKQPKIYRGMTK